jgi:ABC-type Fe3+ transport system permease subunit
VQAFSVFPSAVLLGAPAGPTRVISIAAYQAAFEEYDYSMASAIAMIMGAVQLAIVVAVLSARGLFYRGPAGGGKGLRSMVRIPASRCQALGRRRLGRDRLLHPQPARR